MAKRPRDPVQLAKQVFDIAIGEAVAELETGLPAKVLYTLAGTTISPESTRR